MEAVLTRPRRIRNAGKPRSRMHEVSRRMAARYGPATAARFLSSIGRLQGMIDLDELADAVASGDWNQINAAVGASRLTAIFAGGDSLADVLQGAATATGKSGAELLSNALKVRVGFNAVDPNVVMFAREQAANLVVAVTGDVIEAIRIVTATGALEGLTTRMQAVAIRQVVGLPPNWAGAPGALADELRAGRFTYSRRLSAADKAKILKRIREETVTEEFIEEMRQRYAFSLLNRRAQNIARTETLRAAHHGQRVGWKQAITDGHLPATARRAWIVTPDERLRHGEVPGMNPDGRGIDEPFETPEGSVMNPPSRTNCRCGVGLTFPGLKGVL